MVFGEQPSAAKWNILGTNDASFNDGTGIANFSTSTSAISNPYKFLAYRNAAANTGNNAYAVVACDTEVFDTNNNHSAGVYTVPVTGFYFFYGQVSAGFPASNEYIYTGIFNKGTIKLQGSVLKGLASTSNGSVVSGVLSCIAADTIDLRAFGETTMALNVGQASQNYFGGYLISRT